MTPEACEASSTGETEQSPELYVAERKTAPSHEQHLWLPPPHLSVDAPTPTRPFPSPVYLQLACRTHQRTADSLKLKDLCWPSSLQSPGNGARFQRKLRPEVAQEYNKKGKEMPLVAAQSTLKCDPTLLVKHRKQLSVRSVPRYLVDNARNVNSALGE